MLNEAGRFQHSPFADRLNTLDVPSPILTATGVEELAQAHPDLLFVIVGRPINVAKLRRSHQTLLATRYTHAQGSYPPYNFADLITVMIPMSDERQERAVTLGVTSMDRLPPHTERFDAAYYAKFTDPTIHAHKLEDALLFYDQTETMEEIREETQGQPLRILMLGNAVPSNYRSVRKLMEEGSAITVVDLNQQPIEALRATGQIQPQDQLIVGDVTNMPLPAGQQFDVMFGDFIVNCMDPTRLPHFFAMVRDRLSQHGGLFLSLEGHTYFQQHHLEVLPHAMRVTDQEDSNEYYFLFPYLYYLQLAEAHGLHMEVLHLQEAGQVQNFYLAVTHDAQRR